MIAVISNRFRGGLCVKSTHIPRDNHAQEKSWVGCGVELIENQ